MKLLFVCTGNSCRSPMAESYCQAAAAKWGLTEIEVESAGTSAFSGCTISRHSEQVLNENGIPPASRRSQMLTEEMVRRSDMILVMTAFHKHSIEKACPAARGKTEILGRYLGENREIGDPIGETIEGYRACFENIREAVDQLLRRLQKQKNSAETA